MSEMRYLSIRTESSVSDYSEPIGFVRKVREALNAERSINRFVAIPDSVDGFITSITLLRNWPWVCLPGLEVDQPKAE